MHNPQYTSQTNQKNESICAEAMRIAAQRLAKALENATDEALPELVRMVIELRNVEIAGEKAALAWEKVRQGDEKMKLAKMQAERRDEKIKLRVCEKFVELAEDEEAMTAATATGDWSTTVRWLAERMFADTKSTL